MAGVIGGAPALVLVVEADQAKPGLVGFLVVLAMGVALYFLLRSLSTHLRRVDVDRDARERSTEDPEPGERGDEPIG